MNGSFLLMAFVIGFWCIWSSNREPNSLLEGLTLTIIAIIDKATMEWSGMPNFTPQLLTTWGVLYVFTVAVLEIITRYSVSMGVNLAIAVGGAVGWFFLAQYLFSKPGMDFIAGFVG